MSVTGAQWAELTDALKAQTEATTTALMTQAKAQRSFESLRGTTAHAAVPSSKSKL